MLIPPPEKFMGILELQKEAVESQFGCPIDKVQCVLDGTGSFAAHPAMTQTGFVRAQREKALLDAFVSRLQRRGVIRLGENRARLPGVCALLLPSVSSEQAIASLDLKGILISGGAACASHAGTPSHVYSAMGLSEKDAGCVVRISIGRHTTAQELDIAAQAFEALIPVPARQSTSR